MMITISNGRKYLAGAAVAVLLCSSGYAQEVPEQELLLRRERQARERIEVLKREQDFLLFQKALLAADSKYLILDLGAGKGTLKYRNRILRSFKFPPRRKVIRPALASGAVSLTAKIDGGRRKRQLVFSDSSLIIHAKNIKANVVKGNHAFHIPLGAKDLGSLFYALEPGALAYVIY